MRTTQLDPDFRSNSSIRPTCYCVRCEKAIKEGQKRRWVLIKDWSFAEVVHPEDTEGYDWNNSPGWFPVGWSCAKKIGLEFTKDIEA